MPTGPTPWCVGDCGGAQPPLLDPLQEVAQTLRAGSARTCDAVAVLGFVSLSSKWETKGNRAQCAGVRFGVFARARWGDKASRIGPLQHAKGQRGSRGGARAGGTAVLGRERLPAETSRPR